MKGELPNIAVEGVGNTQQEKLESLFVAETLLIMAGYNVSDDGWNKPIFDDLYNECGLHEIPQLGAFGGDNQVCYFTNTEVCGARRFFKPTELHEMQMFIEKYQKGEIE